MAVTLAGSFSVGLGLIRSLEIGQSLHEALTGWRILPSLKRAQVFRRAIGSRPSSLRYFDG